MGRAYSTNADKRDACTIFVGKPEVKRPLGKPKRRWVDNIKMYLRKIGWVGMDWIDLAQDRDQCRAVTNTLMNLRVPKNLEKFLSSCVTGGFSRRAQLHKVSPFKHLSCMLQISTNISNRESII
jgi:hypothetical protein